MQKLMFSLRLTFVLLSVMLLNATNSAHVRAEPVSPNTTVILQPPCDRQAIKNAILALTPAGGTLKFNCGTATILAIAPFDINANIEIDGENRITLSAGNSRRLFNVGSGAALTLRNIVLTNGYSASSDGGAVLVDHGALRLEHVTIQNSAAVNAVGGAIKLQAGVLEVTDSVIRNNTADSGGGISGFGVITISRSTIAQNMASIDGGGLNVSGTITIDGSDIVSNTAKVDSLASHGGGLALQDPANTTITSSRITGNTAFYCGGIANYDRATLDQVLISENAAANNGGGLCALGQEFVTNSSIVFNRAYSSSAFGFSGNGGGIYLVGQTVASQFINITIGGNLAGERGGGIYVFNGSMALRSVTVYSNTALSNGGGIYQTGSVPHVVSLRNNAFAQNAGGNCARESATAVTLRSNGFNLSSDTTCVLGEPTDVTNTDARLGALANNGGPTPTYLPLAVSPLIDKGTCPDIESIDRIDQRGAHRPVGLTCDIGAVEYGGILARAQLPITIR